MHILLIPFLLGANVVVNETENWNYGAEFTFKGYTNMQVDNDDSTILINTTYPLICRNKNETTISCRVTNITMTTKQRTREMGTEETRKPFEITFNKEGVENIVASSSVEEAFDALRRIAALFSLGVDMSKHREDFANFVETERTVLGECHTRYEITPINELTTSSDETEEERDSAPFDLQLIPLSERNVVIDKIRTISTCEKVGAYLWYIDQDEAQISMRSSHNSMYISQSGTFRSISYANAKLHREDMNRAVEVHEIFGVELVSIRPAEGPLPEVENPSSFSPVVQPIDHMHENSAK